MDGWLIRRGEHNNASAYSHPTHVRMGGATWCSFRSRENIVVPLLKGPTATATSHGPVIRGRRGRFANVPKVNNIGVILDQYLRFKSHVRKAASKGMKAVFALKRPRATTMGRLPTVYLHSRVEDQLCSVRMCWVRNNVIMPPGIRRSFEAIQLVATQAIVGVCSRHRRGGGCD